MMIRYTYLWLGFLLTALNVSAQNDTLWRKGLSFNLNYNDARFYQWAGGSNNSVAANSILAVYAKYSKKKLAWDNTLDLALGAARNGGKGNDFRKTDDRIELNSKVGYDMGKKWFMTYSFAFRTQFTEGFAYNPDNSSNRISNLLAPAYIINSVGFDWKPNNKFSLYLSPVTSRVIIVNDELLSAAGAFGVTPGENIRYEFGALLTAKYTANLAENVALKTRLDLFSNYLEDPQNVDLIWDVLLTFRINKFLQASVNATIAYDDNTIVPKEYENGTIYSGKGVQIKNVLGIGLAYKIEGFGVKTQ